MQQIERYGVIALVFLLVTIVAVSFWGDSKSPGFWSRLTGKSDGKKEQTDTAVATNPLVTDHITDASLPLTAPTAPLGLPPTGSNGLSTGNSPSITDAPIGGSATIPGAQPMTPGSPAPANPFLPQAGPGQAAPAPIAPLPTEKSGATSEYVVQKGDSLALIAKRKLGAESRWTEIQAANPGLDPKHLAAGMKIQLPASSAVASATPTPTITTPKPAPKVAGKASVNTKKPTVASAEKSSSSMYTVKKGDLLRSIARAELGDEKRWKDIAALNPSVDPSKLAVGQKLKMPSSSEARHTVSAPTVAVADKPRVK